MHKWTRDFIIFFHHSNCSNATTKLWSRVGQDFCLQWFPLFSCSDTNGTFVTVFFVLKFYIFTLLKCFVSSEYFIYFLNSPMSGKSCLPPGWSCCIWELRDMIFFTIFLDRLGEDGALAPYTFLNCVISHLSTGMNLIGCK